MKNFEQVLKEGAEGYSFREVIDNLTDEQIVYAANEYAKQFKKLNLHDVSGSVNVDTVNGTNKKLNLWRKITKELAFLNDNNYKARIIYDYVVKHYR